MNKQLIVLKIYIYISLANASFVYAIVTTVTWLPNNTNG